MLSPGEPVATFDSHRTRPSHRHPETSVHLVFTHPSKSGRDPCEGHCGAGQDIKPGTRRDLFGELGLTPRWLGASQSSPTHPTLSGSHRTLNSARNLGTKGSPQGQITW